MKPRISVLMPVLNAEKFLAEAIESILQQTYTDFEFIIIDDGSSDKSVDIIRSYSDPRIIFLQNIDNIGISDTLNKGIQHSRTDLIARMDADDISYPDRLKKQCDYMTANPDIALLSTWARVVDENKKLIRQEKFRPAYYYYNMNFTCWIYHPTVMYRRAAVQQLGGYSVPYAEDYELFWQLMRHYKFYNIPEFLLDYRITDQSLHQVLRKQEYENALKQQVIRNLSFYMGTNFHISADQLECLRGNYIPLLKKNSIAEILDVLRILKEITIKISETKNINCNVQAVREAEFYKRRFLIQFFARNLKRVKGVWLLICTSSWGLLLSLTRSYFRNLWPFLYK